MINLENEDNRKSKKRQRYSFDLNDMKKDTGVMKLFIIAITDDTKESYVTVKLLYDLLNLKVLKELGGRVTIATDLKMANIIMGLMNHASKHPCTWCINER